MSSKKGDSVKYKDYFREYRKRNAEKLKQKKKELLESKSANKTCKECGNKYFSYSSLSKFCSRECFAKDSKVSRRGANNPAYRNGNFCAGNRKNRNSERGFNKIRKQIYDEIENEHGYICCERCKKNKNYKLELHHIIFRSEAPKHKNIHNRRNALLLCVKCHNLFHKKKSTRNEIVKFRGLEKLFTHIKKI